MLKIILIKAEYNVFRYCTGQKEIVFSNKKLGRHLQFAINLLALLVFRRNNQILHLRRTQITY